jgi:hypothetical protein
MPELDGLLNTPTCYRTHAVPKALRQRPFVKPSVNCCTQRVVVLGSTLYGLDAKRPIANSLTPLVLTRDLHYAASCRKSFHVKERACKIRHP